MAALICKDPSGYCGTPSTTEVRNLATFSRVGRRSLNAAEASVAACRFRQKHFPFAFSFSDVSASNCDRELLRRTHLKFDRNSSRETNVR